MPCDQYIIITGKYRANFSPAELICWTELSNFSPAELVCWTESRAAMTKQKQNCNVLFSGLIQWVFQSRATMPFDQATNWSKNWEWSSTFLLHVNVLGSKLEYSFFRI